MSAIIQAAEGRLVAITRTAKALAYEKFLANVRAELSGMTKAQQLKAAKANMDFIRGLTSPRYSKSYQAQLEDDAQRAVTPGMVHVDTILSTMSVMYANDDYIGEQLMPVVPVGKRSDVYWKYPKRERFNYPDDEIGSRSSANELDATRETDNYSVRDYSLKNFLDLETAENQDQPLNEMVDVTDAVNEGLAFKREKRILAIVTASGNYGGNTATATTNWNDTNAPAGGSIVADMLGARSGLWSGPNRTRKIGFCSLAVWNTGIANNAAVRELYKYTGSGLATTTQFANFFGLDDILVSQAREETANIGQTAAYARMITADVFGVLSVATTPTRRSLHFGSTFRTRNTPFATQWNDPNVGVRGGIYSRVAVSEDYKVVAPDAGFLITSILT